MLFLCGKTVQMIFVRPLRLGVTFVGCDKSNQKHAFKYGARKKRGDGFAGEKPHHTSIAPTVKRY